MCEVSDGDFRPICHRPDAKASRSCCPSPMSVCVLGKGGKGLPSAEPRSLENVAAASACFALKRCFRDFDPLGIALVGARCLRPRAVAPCGSQRVWVRFRRRLLRRSQAISSKRPQTVSVACGYQMWNYIGPRTTGEERRGEAEGRRGVRRNVADWPVGTTLADGLPPVHFKHTVNTLSRRCLAGSGRPQVIFTSSYISQHTSRTFFEPENAALCRTVILTNLGPHSM